MKVVWEMIPTSAIYSVLIFPRVCRVTETRLPSMLSTSRGTADYKWIRPRIHTGYSRLISLNGLAGGMRPGPLGGAIVSGPLGLIALGLPRSVQYLCMFRI